MRRWLTILVLAGAVLLPQNLSAQEEEEEQASERDNYAFSVGVGLVDPSRETETYLMAALRIRVNRQGDDEEEDRGGGIRGFIEPEVGYWKSSDDLIEGSDLLVGANLIGVVPFGKVDSFYGAGAGVHFVDGALITSDPQRAEDSETKFGLNAQFGVDIFLTRKTSVFGASRFDLIQGADDDIQSKIYLGFRSRF